MAAIEGIEASLPGKSLEDFQAEWSLKHGVQRGIEIISEASRHLPEPMRAARPEIPWKRIAGIGSVLRHEYHRIADDVVWKVVTDALPLLKLALVQMQAGLEE